MLTFSLRSYIITLASRIERQNKASQEVKSIGDYPSGCGSAWLERLVWDQEVAGSNPVTPIHNIFCGCSSMVEHQPSKLDTWVRFPSPAFFMPDFHFILIYRCKYKYKKHYILSERNWNIVFFSDILFSVIFPVIVFRFFSSTSGQILSGYRHLPDSLLHHLISYVQILYQCNLRLYL